jgi:hypothetical protein
MRMAFGLVGLLVTIGVIAWIMHVYTLPATKKALQTKQRVEEDLGGLTSSGMEDAKASIALSPVMSGSRLKGLQVTSIVPGGPMQARYGLMAGDLIVGAKGQMLDLIAGTDPEMAEIQVFESNGMKLPLIVVRGGKQITLEAAAKLIITAPPGTPAPAPAAPSQPGKPKGPTSPLQDLIPVPSH